ncbi:MAG: hypothetical protein ACKVPY_08005 [Paracoccaceae bacterium]
MSVLRPEVTAALARWSEVIAATGTGVAGLWLMSAGGWVLWPVGLALLAAAFGWVAVAIRRLRFRRQVEAPGVILLDEGQLGYFGPVYGGAMALADLVELRLGWRDGALEWRLRSRDGQMLRIPASALGADRLYDAFAVLPGIDMAALGRSLDDPPRAGVSRPLWTRPGIARPPALVPPPAGGRSTHHHDLS